MSTGALRISLPFPYPRFLQGLQDRELFKGGFRVSRQAPSLGLGFGGPPKSYESAKKPQNLRFVFVEWIQLVFVSAFLRRSLKPKPSTLNPKPSTLNPKPEAKPYLNPPPPTKPKERLGARPAVSKGGRSLGMQGCQGTGVRR